MKLHRPRQRGSDAPQKVHQPPLQTGVIDDHRARFGPEKLAYRPQRQFRLGIHQRRRAGRQQPCFFAQPPLMPQEAEFASQGLLVRPFRRGASYQSLSRRQIEPPRTARAVATRSSASSLRDAPMVDVWGR